MAFESLSDRLTGIIKKIKGQDLIRKKPQFCWEKGGEVGL